MEKDIEFAREGSRIANITEQPNGLAPVFLNGFQQPRSDESSGASNNDPGALDIRLLVSLSGFHDLYRFSTEQPTPQFQPGPSTIWVGRWLSSVPLFPIILFVEREKAVECLFRVTVFLLCVERDVLSTVDEGIEF